MRRDNVLVASVLLMLGGAFAMSEQAGFRASARASASAKSFAVAIDGWQRANIAAREALNVADGWHRLHDDVRGDFLVCNSMPPKDRRL